jgi:hypothetical protein
MTYKQLLEVLENSPEEILNQTVTVYLSQTDEYIAASELSFTNENDVLDEDHLILNVNF